MHFGRLTDHFLGIGVKRLSAVDSNPNRSNQHEVGTTSKMRSDFLGEDHGRVFRTVYTWLGDDDRTVKVIGESTHYNARINKPRSPEWRLYYKTNAVTDAMRTGDTLFLALSADGDLWFIVVPEGSTSEQQMAWLFGIRAEGESFVSHKVSNDGVELNFAARFILDELGIQPELSDTDRLDALIERFGTTFPTTAVFSKLARDTLDGVSANDDPDDALMAWLSHEEALFRRLERRVVCERLQQGFITDEGVDVDGFISFSLGVQNRRKSRMGHSLENHLEAVFMAHGIFYERGARTENGHKPDFLFPGSKAYHERNHDLLMLGAKSTCKDRWRQVLAEAAKIPRKHLLTLEPRITEAQTYQMQASNLQLIVPKSIHPTFTAAQQAWLWPLKNFIEVAKKIV